MSLSQKEKVRLRSRSRKRIDPKALYLYHPASDSWIPAQADEEGRLVIDPSDLDTRYELANTCLLLDGSRKMAGKLDMNTYGIDSVKHILPYTPYWCDIGEVGSEFRKGYFQYLKALNTIETGLINMITATPAIGFQNDDYILYDITNDRYLFYIGYAVVGYIDAAGWHNGPPPGGFG